VSSRSGVWEALTPHQRPHRVYEINRFRFDARAVLRAAAEGGLVLCCVAPADCVVVVSFAVLSWVRCWCWFVLAGP
jgi:hypothetical protein